MPEEQRQRATPVMIESADDRLGEILRDQADLVLLKPISFVQIKALAQRLIKKN